MTPDRFNIRVYGLLEHEGKILLVHEKVGDFHFTKFPGGGLEFGEGMKECLVREFREETGLAIEIVSHFYTTDFFQPSAFKATDQLISVYYNVRSLTDPFQLRPEEYEMVNGERKDKMQFIWVEKEMLNEEMVTFPVDRVVVGMLG